MAVRRVSLFFFASLARAWSARVASAQASEVPWKKALVVGSIFGSKLSGNSVVALLKDERTNDPHPDRNGDLYSRAEGALIDFFTGHDLKDENVVRKLMDSLSREDPTSEGIAKAIDASLRGEPDQRPEVVMLSSTQAKSQAIQQIRVPHEKGSKGVAIVRYVAHPRDESDVQAVQTLLKTMEWSNAFDNHIFLRCIAQSHTAQDLAEDAESDFMIMLEPFSGTLEEFLKDNEVNYYLRMQIFVQVFTHVVRLSTHQIPHRSIINPETVVIKGIVEDVDSVTAVLSAGILSGYSNVDILDRFNEDVKELGALLRYMLSEPWPMDVRLRADVGLAFGTALESGALTGYDTIKQEFSDIMRILFTTDFTDDFLRSARINYLSMGLNAAKSLDKGSARVAA